MLEATFQTRVPFLGEMREPGEVVGKNGELSAVSRTVLDALAAQKVILLNDGSAPGPHDPEAVAHLQARMDKLADQLTAEAEARAADALAAKEQIETLKGALGEAVQAAVAKALDAAPAAAERAARQKGA